jgi:hypothetical protein
MIWATDTTDVTDELLVTNKILLIRINYPLHPLLSVAILTLH